MPVEDANEEWPEEESPYQPIARVAIPVQDSYSAGRAGFVEKLSFSPAHALAAHRPLGSINRARLYAYKVLQAKRQAELGVPDSEPTSMAEFPE